MPAPTRPAAVGVVVEGADRCNSPRIGDGEVVAADPTATGLAIKEPVAIGHAEPGSQGRDPTIVGSLDSSDRRKKYGTGIVIIRNPIEVPFNSENEVANLPVEPELAACRQRDELLFAAAIEERVGTYDERARSQLDKRREYSLEVSIVTSVQDTKL